MNDNFKESPDCNQETLMSNMTIEIDNEAKKLGADIVCGASYQISGNAENRSCLLYFQGTAGTKRLIDNELFENALWEWLMFGCIALIAFVETLSAVQQLLKWKTEVYPYVCGDDNSSQGSGNS